MCLVLQRTLVAATISSILMQRQMQVTREVQAAAALLPAPMLQITAVQRQRRESTTMLVLMTLVMLL